MYPPMPNSQERHTDPLMQANARLEQLIANLQGGGAGRR